MESPYQATFNMDADDIDEAFYDATASAGLMFASPMQSAGEMAVERARRRAPVTTAAGTQTGVGSLISSLFPSMQRTHQQQVSAMGMSSTRSVTSFRAVGAIGLDFSTMDPPTSEESAARIEHHLWGLVHRALEICVPSTHALTTDLLQAGSGFVRRSAAGASLPADTCASDASFALARAQYDPDTTLLDCTLQWLQECAARDVILPAGLPLSSSRDTRASHDDPMARAEDMWQATCREAGGPLQLDAEVCGDAVLQPSDCQRDVEVLNGVWLLLRSGRSGEAQALATTGGRPWLATVIESVREWQDAPGPDGGPVRRGNPHASGLLLPTAVQAAQLLEERAAEASGAQAHAAALEAGLLRAIVATVGGGSGATAVDPPDAVFPPGSDLAGRLSCEDRLWLALRAYRGRLAADGQPDSTLYARLRGLAVQQGLPPGDDDDAACTAATLRTPRSNIGAVAALSQVGRGEAQHAVPFGALLRSLPDSLEGSAGGAGPASSGGVDAVASAYPRIVCAILRLARAGCHTQLPPPPGDDLDTVGGALALLLREVHAAALPLSGPYAEACAANEGDGATPPFTLASPDALCAPASPPPSTRPLRSWQVPLVRFGALLARFLRRPGTGTRSLVDASAPSLGRTCDDLSLAYARHLACATPRSLHVDAVVACVACVGDDARAVRALAAFVLALPPTLEGAGEDGTQGGGWQAGGGTQPLHPRRELFGALARVVRRLASAEGGMPDAQRLVEVTDAAVRNATAVLVTLQPEEEEPQPEASAGPGASLQARDRLASAAPLRGSGEAPGSAGADALTRGGLPLPLGAEAAAGTVSAQWLTRLGSLQLLRLWAECRRELAPPPDDGEEGGAEEEDEATDALLLSTNVLLRECACAIAASQDVNAIGLSPRDASEAMAVARMLTGDPEPALPFALPQLAELAGDAEAVLAAHAAAATATGDGGGDAPPPPLVEFAVWCAAFRAVSACGALHAQLGSAQVPALLAAAAQAARQQQLQRVGPASQVTVDMAQRHAQAVQEAAAVAFDALIVALTALGLRPDLAQWLPDPAAFPITALSATPLLVPPPQGTAADVIVVDAEGVRSTAASAGEAGAAAVLLLLSLAVQAVSEPVVRLRALLPLLGHQSDAKQALVEVHARVEWLGRTIRATHSRATVGAPWVVGTVHLPILASLLSAGVGPLLVLLQSEREAMAGTLG